LIYGSAKAAFSTYIDGLRNYLFKSGVHVSTIKPGYVRTKMIEGQQTPSFITATSEQVAEAVWKAYRGKKSTVYTLARWRCIMFILKLIPEFIFKRLSL
jgi:short-subunit dehydrogenase